MAALATFCESPVAGFYAQVCERYGQDPGALFAEDDDVLAFNVTAALAVKTQPVETEESKEGIVTDLLQKMQGV